MSFFDIKAIKGGIYIPSNDKHSVIIPLRIVPNSNIQTIKNDASFNRLMFYHFYQNLTHYTISFEKKSSSSFILIIFPYFSSSNISEIKRNVKTMLNHFKDLLDSQGFHFEIIDSNYQLGKIKYYIPTKIHQKKEEIFEFSNSQGIHYFTMVQLYIRKKSHEKVFFLLLQDFLSTLSIGSLNIDVINHQEYSNNIPKHLAQVAITISAFSQNWEEIRDVQQQLIQFKMLLNSNQLDDKELFLDFLTIEEYQTNIGKLLFKQGLKYFDTDHEGILNYELFLNLLKKSK